MNSLFGVLADWNTYLKQENIDLSEFEEPQLNHAQKPNLQEPSL